LHSLLKIRLCFGDQPRVTAGIQQWMRYFTGFDPFDLAGKVALRVHRQVDIGIERLLNAEGPQCVVDEGWKLLVPDQLHSSAGTSTGLENDRVGLALFCNTGRPGSATRRLPASLDSAQ